MIFSKENGCCFFGVVVFFSMFDVEWIACLLDVDTRNGNPFHMGVKVGGFENLKSPHFEDLSCHMDCNDVT